MTAYKGWHPPLIHRACGDPSPAELTRRNGVSIPGWVPCFPGQEEQPRGGHLFHVEELLPHGVMRLRRIRPDGSISKNPADLAYSTVQEVFRLRHCVDLGGLPADRAIRESIRLAVNRPGRCVHIAASRCYYAGVPPHA